MNGALSKDDVEAGQRIQGEIESMKTDMLKDASLAPLPADGGSDVHEWNEEFKTLQTSTWLNSSWLYTECYMHRLMHSFFSKLSPLYKPSTFSLPARSSHSLVAKRAQLGWRRGLMVFFTLLHQKRSRMKLHEKRSLRKW